MTVELEPLRLDEVLSRRGYIVERCPGGVHAVVGHDPRRVRAADRRAGLTRELVAVLDLEPAGLPAAELAPRLQRRRADLLRVLHGDPRFERQGASRAARWHLRNPSATTGTANPAEWPSPRPITPPDTHEPAERATAARTIATSREVASS